MYCECVANVLPDKMVLDRVCCVCVCVWCVCVCVLKSARARASERARERESERAESERVYIAFLGTRLRAHSTQYYCQLILLLTKTIWRITGHSLLESALYARTHTTHTTHTHKHAQRESEREREKERERESCVSCWRLRS
jgi:hypothetical protein